MLYSYKLYIKFYLYISFKRFAQLQRPKKHQKTMALAHSRDSKDMLGVRHLVELCGWSVQRESMLCKVLFISRHENHYIYIELIRFFEVLCQTRN